MGAIVWEFRAQQPVPRLHTLSAHRIQYKELNGGAEGGTGVRIILVVGLSNQFLTKQVFLSTEPKRETNYLHDCCLDSILNSQKNLY